MESDSVKRQVLILNDLAVSKYLLSDTSLKQPTLDFSPSKPPSPRPSLTIVDDKLRETTLGKPLSDRVLAYLAKAEVSEPDAWMRDDIRVAWLTVLRAAQGHPDPWRYSFWTYFGAVPEKVIPYWQQREIDREWALGRVAALIRRQKQSLPLSAEQSGKSPKPPELPAPRPITSKTRRIA